MDLRRNQSVVGDHRIYKQAQTSRISTQETRKSNQRIKRVNMCYFTKKVLNKRFLPNRKNGWNPPVCTEERFRYVEVECGHCFECRKKREENGESEITNN